MELLDVITALQEREDREGYDVLEPYEKVVVDVAGLEAEVNNGGFDQFFFNSASDRAPAIVAALKAIGAFRAAEILEEACQLFPRGKPSEDRSVRQEQLEKIDPDRLDALDERFSQYPDPIGELLERYCRKKSLLP
jgi:hypothetical protein